ncbi:hypothetical protein J6G99_06480 [bacterium]|nr:hypothetical protein [bacterium]
MGMAASQARLLTITARLSDNELRSQMINNAKMRLASESAKVSDEYVNALNDAQLMFSNVGLDGLTQNQKLTFNALTAYSPYNTQYGLVNSAGQILVSEAEDEYFRMSGGNLEKFLKLHNLDWDTTYFNEGKISDDVLNTIGGDWSFLFEGVSNVDLKQQYEELQTLNSSVEIAQYDKLAKEYYSQLSASNSYSPIVDNIIESLKITNTNTDGSETTISINDMINNFEDTKIAGNAHYIVLITEYIKKIYPNDGFTLNFGDKIDLTDGKMPTYTINGTDYQMPLIFGNNLSYYDSKINFNYTYIGPYSSMGTSTDSNDYRYTYGINNYEYTVTNTPSDDPMYDNTVGVPKPRVIIGSQTDPSKDTKYQYSIPYNAESIEDINVINEYGDTLTVHEYSQGSVTSQYYALYSDIAYESSKEAMKAYVNTLITQLVDAGIIDTSAMQQNEVGNSEFLNTYGLNEATFSDNKYNLSNYLRATGSNAVLSPEDLIYRMAENQINDEGYITGYHNLDGYGNEKFQNLVKAVRLEKMVEVLGEPKYTWTDYSDVNSNTENASAKAQWYTNLFNRMKQGYKVLENGLASSQEWIEYAFENGIVSMEQVDLSFKWKGIDYKNCSKITTETVDQSKVALAEAKYNRAMNDIQHKDQMFDLELKNIDTEHTALQTEYDVIKGVIKSNIERNFKFDQSA